jgi:hypothetical protein
MARAIMSDEKLYRVFRDYAMDVRKGKILPYGISPKFKRMDEKRVSDINHEMRESRLGRPFMDYWDGIMRDVRVIDVPATSPDGDVFIAGNNSIIVPEGKEMDSLIEAVRAIDGNKIFYSRMVMRLASERLNNYEGEDDDYFDLLMEERNTIRGALPNYKAFMNAIREVGSDEYHFIEELIQNADDCLFGEASPSFRIEHSGRTICTYTNELGFTKQDLRSITAIGESSKTSMLTDNRDTIGEKGLGFKSVFRVASSVDIYSGNFSFRLSKDSPTVPERLPHAGNGRFEGT